MKNLRYLMILVVLGACSKEAPAAKSFEERIAELAPTSPTNVIKRSPTGLVEALETSVPVPASKTSLPPEEQADWFIDKFKDDLGLDTENLNREKVQSGVTGDALGAGGSVITYVQEKDGVAIFGSRVKVVISKDVLGNPVVTAVFVGNVPADIADINTVPTIDSVAALNTTKTETGRDTSSALLTIINFGSLAQIENTPSHLVWRVESERGANFVNAHSGLLYKYFLTNEISVEKDIITQSFSCVMDDKGNMVGNVDTIHETDDRLIETPMGSEADDAHAAANTVYDYFADTHDYRGPDGMCGQFTVITEADQGVFDPADCGTAMANAFWSDEIQTMVFGEGFVSLDILAHEYTHGVIEGTAAFNYAHECGALHEGLADVFAAFIDTDNPWEIGESLPGGAIRDASNPGAYGHPAYVGDPNQWTFEPDQETCLMDADCGTTNCIDPATNGCSSFPCTEFMCDKADGMMLPGGQTMGRCVPLPGDCNDKGGVHQNATIISHAAYLIQEGGVSPQDSSIMLTGIGQEATERLMFLALSNYLSSDDDFEDFGFKVGAAARYLTFNHENQHLNLAECSAVINALAAAGLGEPDDDGDCLSNDIDICDSYLRSRNLCGNLGPNTPNPNNPNPMGPDGGMGSDGGMSDDMGTPDADVDPCNDFMGCGDCNNQPGCGFCLSSGMCESDSKAAACGDWRTSPSTCEPCDAGDCNSCAASGFCSWCPGSGCMNDALLEQGVLMCAAPVTTPDGC